jgi:sporulation protein YlmC with PRC-barrel domain
VTAPAPQFHAADFHLGAAVVTSDGVRAGTLHFVIVDGELWDLRELVVEESRRFSGHLFSPGTALMSADVIVPLQAVAHVAHDRIDLAITAAQVRGLPPYLSYEYGPPPRSQREALAIAVAPLGAGVPLRPLTETAAKAPSDIEIYPGEPVMLGHSGKRLGRVRDIVYDGTELVGIVIDPGGLFAEDVLLQVRFLERGDDAALFANLRPSDLENLKPYHPDESAP